MSKCSFENINPDPSTHYIAVNEVFVKGDKMVIMDFPTAWAFVKDTLFKDHHKDCSWRTTFGALLCDCNILWDEYERRKVAQAGQ